MTLFEKIIARQLPADIVYEDEQAIVIKDINPQAPTHYLVVPKRVITGMSALQLEDAKLLGHLMLVAARVAREANLADGYRVVVNNGTHGQQSVDHLHVHVIGGRQMHWPPG